MRPAIRHALRPLAAVVLSSIALFGCDDTSWRIDEAETKTVDFVVRTPWPASASDRCVVKKVSDTASDYLVCFYNSESAAYKLNDLRKSGQILTDALPGSPERRAKMTLPPVLRIDLETGASHQVDWQDWEKCKEPITDRFAFDGSWWGSGRIENRDREQASGTLNGKTIQSAAPYLLSTVGHRKGGLFLLFGRFGPTETRSGLFAPDATIPHGDLALEWRDPNSYKRIGPAMRVRDSGFVSGESPKNYAYGWTWDQKYFLLKVGDRLFILKNPAPLADSSAPANATPKSVPAPAPPSAPQPGKP